jgi:hypothetical protein
MNNYNQLCCASKRSRRQKPQLVLIYRRDALESSTTVPTDAVENSCNDKAAHRTRFPEMVALAMVTREGARHPGRPCQRSAHWRTQKHKWCIGPYGLSTSGVGPAPARCSTVAGLALGVSVRVEPWRVNCVATYQRGLTRWLDGPVHDGCIGVWKACFAFRKLSESFPDHWRKSSGFCVARLRIGGPEAPSNGGATWLRSSGRLGVDDIIDVRAMLSDYSR